MHAVLKFDKGFNGNIEITTAARPKDLHASLSVVGEKGTMVISGIGLNKIHLLNLKINKKKILKIKKKIQ